MSTDIYCSVIQQTRLFTSAHIWLAPQPSQGHPCGGLTPSVYFALIHVECSAATVCVSVPTQWAWSPVCSICSGPPFLLGVEVTTGRAGWDGVGVRISAPFDCKSALLLHSARRSTDADTPHRGSWWSHKGGRLCVCLLRRSIGRDAPGRGHVAIVLSSVWVGQNRAGRCVLATVRAH